MDIPRINEETMYHTSKRTAVNRILVLGLLTCSLCLGWASQAGASSIRVIELGCQVTQEKDANGDELRLEIISDTGQRVTLRENGVKKQTSRTVERTLSYNKSVTFRLTEIDTVAADGIHFQDEDLGSVTVGKQGEPGRDPSFPPIQYATFKGHGSHYVVSYQVMPSPPVQLELISLRCVTTQEKDSDGDELRLHIKADNGSERIDLNSERRSI